MRSEELVQKFHTDFLYRSTTQDLGSDMSSGMEISHTSLYRETGADPGFFLGGGALVSCSTSTPINHIVFFFFCRIPVVLKNCRSSRGGRGGVCTPCILPLDPPLGNQWWWWLFLRLREKCQWISSDISVWCKVTLFLCPNYNRWQFLLGKKL